MNTRIAQHDTDFQLIKKNIFFGTQRIAEKL